MTLHHHHSPQISFCSARMCSSVLRSTEVLEPKPSIVALPGVNCRIYGHLQSGAFGGQWTGKWKFMSTSLKGSKKWRQARSARWVSCHTYWHSTAPLAHRDSPILLVKGKGWFKFPPRTLTPVSYESLQCMMQSLQHRTGRGTIQRWLRSPGFLSTNFFLVHFLMMHSGDYSSWFSLLSSMSSLYLGTRIFLFISPLSLCIIVFKKLFCILCLSHEGMTQSAYQYPLPSQSPPISGSPPISFHSISQLKTGGMAPISWGSQHPHGGSGPPVTLAPEDLMPSSGLLEYQAHTCSVHTYMHTLTHLK